MAPPCCVDKIGSFISSNDQLSREQKKQSGRSAKKTGAKAPTDYMFNPSQKNNWRLKVKSLPTSTLQQSKSLTYFYTKKTHIFGVVYC